MCTVLATVVLIENTELNFKSAVIRSNRSCLHLMILEADLLLLVLKRGNLFDENCDGVQHFGNCCD